MEESTMKRSLALLRPLVMSLGRLASGGSKDTPADESPAARAYTARTASADTAILWRKLACMLS